MYLVTRHDLVMQILRDPPRTRRLFGGASMPLPADVAGQVREVMADG